MYLTAVPTITTIEALVTGETIMFETGEPGDLAQLFFGADPAAAEQALAIVAPVAEAIGEFFTQPFGAVGAVFIMAAVTVLNSRGLRSRIHLGEAGIGYLFNGLNLLGGVCLFVNAVIRDEPVWLVLEVYFVTVAVKGLIQTARMTARPAPEVLVS